MSMRLYPACLSYWKLMFLSLDQLWNSDIPIFMEWKWRPTGFSTLSRRKYQEDVSGGSIWRMYTDQWNSFDHVNELRWVCAKLCLNLPGQLKNQFLQKWKKYICGKPMQKMFKIISCVIKTFYTLCIKTEISIKGKIKILVPVQEYWGLVFSMF